MRRIKEARGNGDLREALYHTKISFMKQSIVQYAQNNKFDLDYVREGKHSNFNYPTVEVRGFSKDYEVTFFFYLSQKREDTYDLRFDVYDSGRGNFEEERVLSIDELTYGRVEVILRGIF